MDFLDTNVLLYAIGAAHPARRGSRRTLARLEAGELEATTSTEVIQELLHVVRRRRGAVEAAEVARRALGMFSRLLPVGPADISLATDLVERHPSVPTRDCVHAATMINAGLSRIVSTDPHFDSFDDLVRIDPSQV